MTSELPGLRDAIADALFDDFPFLQGSSVWADRVKIADSAIAALRSTLAEPDGCAENLVAALTARFEKAQRYAGEDLSPWNPEGFAVIASEAVIALFAPPTTERAETE